MNVIARLGFKLAFKRFHSPTSLLQHPLPVCRNKAYFKKRKKNLLLEEYIWRERIDRKKERKTEKKEKDREKEKIERRKREKKEIEIDRDRDK